MAHSAFISESSHPLGANQRVCHHIFMKNLLIKLLFVTALVFLTATSMAADTLTWPEQEKGLPWPKRPNGHRIIEDRFYQGSTNSLGSATDLAAIKSAVATARPSGSVVGIRWLSARLVMVKVRLTESQWYYVVERRKDDWTILTYYLDWIS